MSYSDAPPPPPPGQPQYGAPAPGAQKNSGKAVASLVTGLDGLLTICCGFFAIVSIVAVVLGFLARKDIAASNGQLKGEGMATAGIVTGALGIILLVVSIVLVVTGVIDTNFDYSTPN